MFKYIHFNALRNSENVQFFNDVVKLCTNNDPEALQISPQVNDLEGSVQELNSHFKTDRGNEITSELVILDERRDKAVTSLRTLTEGYSNHFLSEKQVAGIKLMGIIDSFGGSIARLNYQAETSTLAHLCKILQSDTEAVAHVATLGLGDLVDELNNANTKFNNRYLARVKAEASSIIRSTGDLIMECIKKYRTLANHISAHATLNPGEAIDTLISQMNELIEKYVQLIVLRTESTKEEAI